MKSHSCKWLFLLLIGTTMDDSYAKEAQPFLDILTKPPVETKLELSTPVILAGFLCFVAASISSAGGVGGGGLFIPILTIITRVDLKTASSFSAFMVTGASIANVVCNLAAAIPRFGGKTLIDFDIALLSQPSILLGVSVGVICNVVFPEWLITILFAVFLAWSSTKTCKNGVRSWKLETEERRCGESENGLVRGVEVCDGESENGRVKSSVKEPLLGTDKFGNCQSKFPWMKLGVLVLVWCSFCLVYLLRGNRYGEGIASIEPCGVAYWLLSSSQILLAIVYTAWSLCRKESSQVQKLNRRDDVEEQTQAGQSNKLIFPQMALLSGILGGLFGIGGGMLISPLLLQVGVAPEVTSATCSFMVLFSSTMSAFQYLLLGMEHTDVALIFAAICFVASLLGLVVVQKAIQEYGRASLIVFSVGIVMALSTVLMTSFGAIDVWRDYISGEYMGFKRPC
ncbi:hypothetical protein TIFTF001_042718 [Ficus carica]|uniref:Sulfite exporter TauE/SafE family protein n=2 Tax=Ficus carica TaxID=3494 RepID=A0AA88CWU9_FICCA|nr:hypothetical protein TIFTF001_042915 [Ficus carica]GMN19721.1 hypothetical protein TIFTF001_042916 [Ficus carica]GMN37928.1 hypothetical protein TIFTF001_042717 [Ficus carica]GMN37936.1 hypothetical protein TIFTF001_042718 [Ficus carica]